MSCEKSSFNGQFACACRAQSGKAAYEQVKQIAPDLPADWEKTEEWAPVSETVTGRDVICGGCKSWWVGAIREVRQELALS